MPSLRKSRVAIAAIALAAGCETGRMIPRAPTESDGDLGSFWNGELSWNADTQTLVAGPVPATTPTLPVSLALHFEGPTLVTVDATMASGVRYHFQASARQP